MKEKKHGSAKKTQPSAEKYLSMGTIGELWGHGNWKNLFAPVDISSLVFFRILFGLIMFYEVTRYFSHGWISRYWIEPKYHFTYWPFDFLKPLPGDGMFLVFYAMGALAICIAIGLFYRASMFLFWLLFSYQFLLEQTRYLNHFYLVILISFVMIFVPANTSASVDSRIFKNIRSETAPAWSLWLMRFMVGLPYFFGGIAKINPDWLQGQPLHMWLEGSTGFPVIGSLFKYQWMALVMAYSGLFLDLLIVPALLFKKTRIWGFLSIALFHSMNSQLFQIGIFPWFMIAATSLYFNPDWLRKFLNFFTGNSWAMTLPEKGKWTVPEQLSVKQKIILVMLAVWVSFQSLVPLRHFFIPGVVHWSEEGHRYSWHMKLRTKRGMGDFIVMDKKTGKKEIVDPMNYLTPKQKKSMIDTPYLIWQFCRIVKKDYKDRGLDVAVYADIKASLNGRKYQQLIDPNVDLTSVPRPIFPASWIIPLTTSLSDKPEKDSELNSLSEE